MVDQKILELSQVERTIVAMNRLPLNLSLLTNNLLRLLAVLCGNYFFEPLVLALFRVARQSRMISRAVGLYRRSVHFGINFTSLGVFSISFNRLWLDFALNLADL